MGREDEQVRQNQDTEPIDTIFFDVGGVCLTNAWGRESREEAAFKFSIPFEEMEKRHQACFEPWERNEISLDTYLSEVVFHTDRSFARQEFIEFMKSQSQGIVQSLQLVNTLKQTGRYRLATINNENLALNEYRIKHFKLRELFVAFFSSCYLGIRKPKKRVYEMALQIMAILPGQALFIDDRQENLQTAALMGMQTIHFQDTDQLYRQLKARHIL